MNILLSGICGFMGREVVKLCEANYRGASLAFGVDPNGNDNVYRSLDDIPSTEGIDCIIDFSHHSATPALLDFAIANRLPLVLCTTGHTEDEKELISKASARIPLFYSGNMSVGIALLMELAKTTAAAFPEAEIEIIEKHHSAKLDAPSGTALMLANAIRSVREKLTFMLGRSGRREREKNEIGIHAVRAGSIVGEHEIIVATKNEIITLSHSAMSRSVFADGALAAAKWICDKTAGLYAMQDMIK